jgi:glycine/D-amino acid oxidase-like deaminating enzyme
MSQPSLPNSLWAATAASAPATPPLEVERDAEVAVIGGGFTGLSAALHLAEAGVETVLLEQAEPGWGASGRNGGQVIPGFKHDPDELVARYGAERGERLAAFAGGVADLVFDLVEKHGIDCHAARKGWIQAAHCRSALRKVEARARQWASRGAPVETVDAVRMAEVTGTEFYVGGWIDRRGGTLQPLSYARGLARAAQRAGAALHGGSPAVSLQRHDGRWRVETPGGAVTAEQVLIGTNGYTDGLWPGLARTVIPVYSYQVATRPLSDNLRRSILPQGHASSDTRRLLQYYRLDHMGRLVVGGRGRFLDSEDPRFYADVVRGLKGLYPHLGEPELEFFWCGRVAITLGHMLHLHELAPGVTAAIGYNGRGVAMATAVGKLLAERARGTALEELPLPASPLRPIPFHGLCQPAVSMAVTWKKLLDRMEMARR